MDEDRLLDGIYEAGVFQERWPEVLHDIAKHVGARGGNLIRSNASGVTLTSSLAVADLTQEFISAGWNEKNSRVSRLLSLSPHPGFLTDADVHTAAELSSLPIYTEFLTPRKADAGAATLIQGASHDAVVLAIECFPDHASAAGAVAKLNHLRPHIARALVMGNNAQKLQNAKVIQSFEAMQLSVALLSRTGKILAATTLFSTFLGELMRDGRSRLMIIDAEGDRHFETALRKLEHSNTGASLAIRDKNRVGQAALHLVPARRDARDIFSDVFSFAILSHPDNASVPGADLISALFDLTPAEARVARAIATGQSLKALSSELRTSEETLRTQLKKVFMKTCTRRQGDLSLLLSKLAI
ncbi:hypothetical protein [Sphingobium sp. BS19]|uniref:helix-turn-helix transcriptional regulator n=1 Tax=Sphingobium sp. BS19 TaxID=3018973 RepID=UPI0022EF4EBF|nr:hypothetical protein [Sphingobium sp. BS19]GLI97040.1 DNA-binding protein [Sphingobium sp. BS19]